MSSLRLALKQSLEESGQQAAEKRERERRQREEETRRRRKREQRPGQKKRGPGRPRKDASLSLQSPHGEPRGRLNSGSTTGSSDDDVRYSKHIGGSSSSENEFSGSSDNDTSHAALSKAGDVLDSVFDDSGEHNSEEYSARRKKMKKKQRAMKRHRNTAANRIQSQWKKKKGTQNNESVGTSSGQQGNPADEPGSGQKARSSNVEKTKASSSTSGRAKTVPPPASEIISWMSQLSVEAQRKYITAGHRVKVRFEMKKKRDGKIIRRQKWYGGLVTGVSTGGSKIRIKYDDGTMEVSKYPDPDDDIVVDAEGNGRHRVSAEKFLPPLSYQKDEELETPPPRYHSPSTDGSVDIREKGKARKIVSTPKSSSRKLKISKVKVVDDEEVTSPQPEVPSPASVRTAGVQPAGEPSSPGRGNVSDEDSPDRGMASVKTPIQSMEDAEQMQAKHTEDGLEESAGDSEQNESNQTESAVKASSPAAEMSTDSIVEDSVKEQKPWPSSDVVKKPSLTIRLIPPKVVKRQSEQAKLTAEDHNGTESEKHSSDEDMSDGFEGTVEHEKVGATIEQGRILQKPVSSERRGSKSDVVVNTAGGVLELKTSRSDEHEPSLAGIKRPVSEDADDGAERPKKKQTLEWDTEVDGKPKHSSPAFSGEVQSSPDIEQNGTKTESVGGDTPERESTQIAKSKESSTSKSVEDPDTRVEQDGIDGLASPSDSGLPTSSKHTGESLGNTPTQVVHREKRKIDHDSSSSPVAPEEKRSALLGSPETDDSPTPLSAEPRQCNDDITLSKPVSSVATPVKLDEGESGGRTKDDPVLTGSKNSAFNRKESMTSGEDEEKPRLLPLSASGSDEESAGRSMTPLPQEAGGGKGSTVSVPRSGRRAAKQANQRIASRQPLVIQDPFAKTKRKRDKLDSRTPPETTRKRSRRHQDIEDDDDGRHWVQCDNCQKWRILPSTVETDKLPKHWYCEMNVYDSARNTCDAPEQSTEEETARKKRRRKKGRVSRAETPVDTQSAKEDKELSRTPDSGGYREEAMERLPSRSPSVEKNEMGKSPLLGDSPQKPRRSSPSSAVSTNENGSPQPDADGGLKIDTSKRQQPVGSSSAKKAKSDETDEGKNSVPTDDNAETPAPKGKRGRKRTKDATIKENEKGRSGKNSSKEEEAENQEWVQCEKCEKWRRLPPHISSEDLPEVWYCDMNTWDRATASCDVEEDKTDPNIREYNIFGTGQSSYGTSGKLSYRNLMFGTAGRRQNRPISERTRAAESLFATPLDENGEGNGHPTVTYANSSAFLPRKSSSSVEDSGRVSLFDLMSHSNLWAELHGGSSVGSQLANGGNTERGTSMTAGDSLSIEMKRSLKDLVYHALGAGTLAGHEVLLEAQCRQWETTPQHWERLRALCTLDVVTRMLLELVHDGLVEVARDAGSDDHAKMQRYRRVSVPGSMEPSTASSRDPARSRILKIAKPWKKRQ